MLSLSKELHVQTVTIDYHSIFRKVSSKIKKTVGRESTEKTYSFKNQPFQEFCDIVYGNEDFPRTIRVKNRFSVLHCLQENKIWWLFC